MTASPTFDDAPYPSLVDRVVFVTGGSRGIGKAMALGLARAGARVAISGSAASPALAAAREELKGIAGEGRALAIAADVCSFDECRAAAAAAIATFGTIHCLINNAGVGMQIVRADYPVHPIKFWEADADACRRMFDINVNGVFNMALAVVPHLVARRFGKIVNISTSEAVLTLGGFAPYGPSKAAVESASHIWAKDLQGQGVDVNVFLPGGATDTDLMPRFPGRSAYSGGMMPPDVMVPGILWLCSDDSNGTTGERYVARLWDSRLPPAQAAQRARTRSVYRLDN
jgi:3-oxoacyl-[acyl-carrier protein] reductase